MLHVRNTFRAYIKTHTHTHTYVRTYTGTVGAHTHTRTQEKRRCVYSNIRSDRRDDGAGRVNSSQTGRARRRSRTAYIRTSRWRNFVRRGLIIVLKLRNATGLRNNNKSGHLQCTSLTVAVRPMCRSAKYPSGSSVGRPIWQLPPPA